MQKFYAKFLGPDGMVRFIAKNIDNGRKRDSVTYYDPRSDLPEVYAISTNIMEAKLFATKDEAKKILGMVKAHQRRGAYEKIAPVIVNDDDDTKEFM